MFSQTLDQYFPYYSPLKMLNEAVCLETLQERCFLCKKNPGKFTVVPSVQDLTTFDIVGRSLALCALPLEPSFAVEHVLKRQTLRLLSKGLGSQVMFHWVLAAGQCAVWYFAIEKKIPKLTGKRKKKAEIRKQLLFNTISTLKKYLKNIHMACQMTQFEHHLLRSYHNFKL